MPTLTQSFSLLAVAPLALAAMTDLVSRRVPNWASASVAAVGLAMRVVHGDWPYALAAASLTFGLLFWLWTRGWLGGGDVKLLAACTLLVPAYAVPNLVFMVTMAGGALSLVYLAGRRARPGAGPRPAHASAFRRVCRVEAWRIRRHAPLPYACAIAAGSVFTLVTG